MAELYKNKYRTKSARLPAWDYSWEGYYFVTICVKKHKCLFGYIENSKMILNAFGKIAVEYWLKITGHFNNVVLDEFIVMPNHIHGIIIIKNNIVETRGGVKLSVETQHARVSTTRDGAEISSCRDAACCVSTTRGNADKSKTFYKLKPKSLSVIIRSYKSIVTKIINQKFSKINFQWQSRFYDHIIRSEESLNRIKEYIIDNPRKWDEDINNPKNIKF